VDVPSDSGVERVLNYLPTDAKSPQDPAITVHTLDQGRVVFVSTSANDDWMNFAAKPNYPPLMHELLSGSVRTGDYWMNLTVGQSIKIPPTVRVTSTPSITDPNGLPVVVDIAPDSDSHDGREAKGVYHTAPINKPGIYTLSLGGDRKVPIAVNVPARDEANVTTLTDDAILHALGDIKLSMQPAEISTEVVAGREGNDFSWWTMVAVLGLVLFECFIAMSFGHYRRQEVGATAPAPARPGRASQAAVPSPVRTAEVR
jgi:hypothetical protein